MLVKVLGVFVKLSLGVDILKTTGVVPPLGRGLHQHLVRLQFFNQLLGALSQHGRLVGSANQIHVFAVESLSQVDQGGLEAVVSK